VVFAVYTFRIYLQKQKANIAILAQKQVVEHQKNVIEDKQKEILDSIHYAHRIQKALIPTEKYVEKILEKLHHSPRNDKPGG